jgi:predicted DNA-binding ribbon-helix-helix protein
MTQGIRKHSVRLAGHRTSVSLEPEFWQAIRDIARQRDMPLDRLITSIDSERGKRNLSSAIRVFVLAHAKSLSPS